MDIPQFIGLQKFYQKRLDSNLMLLDDSIQKLEAQLNGFKGRIKKGSFSAEGMIKKLLGSVFMLRKLSSEVLTLSGLGDASGSELMDEIRKAEKALKKKQKSEKSKSPAKVSG